MPLAYQAPGKSDPALSPQALDAWWRLYEDPQLTALVEGALLTNFDARTGLQRIAESRAARAQALAAYLPQGDLVGSAQNQHTSESFGGVGVSTSLGSTGSSTGSLGTTGTTGSTTTTDSGRVPYAVR